MAEYPDNTHSLTAGPELHEAPLVLLVTLHTSFTATNNDGGEELVT